VALRILFGLVAGALVGAFVTPHAPWLVDYVAKPAGSLFLRLLLVLVMPLAAAALVLGVAELKPGAIGAVAVRAFGLTLGLTAAGVGIGIALVTIVQPGRGVDRSALPAGESVAPITTSPVDTFVQMVPDNVVGAAARGELLGVLIVALLVGLALRRTPTEAAERFRVVVQGLFDVLVSGVQMVMWLAPVGVAGLVCVLVAKTGLSGLAPLARFVGVVVGAILIQAIVVYGVALKVVAKRSPVGFYAAVEPALAMAFSTASSAATLPTTLRVAEDGLRLHPELARFVLTVGASANQNGTALFEGVAVLFLAQLYGVDLSFAQQAFVVLVAIAAGVGTAGVPGASMPVIAAIAASIGVPPESVGVLVGVDRFLDMCRTTLNVAGDLVIAACVNATEDRPPLPG
jgi:DAACS family dicarboxylate/amino acid:cation (Na+ or H+) symporter